MSRPAVVRGLHAVALHVVVGAAAEAPVEAEGACLRGDEHEADLAIAVPGEPADGVASVEPLRERIGVRPTFLLCPDHNCFSNVPILFLFGARMKQYFRTLFYLLI